MRKGPIHISHYAYAHTLPSVTAYIITYIQTDCYTVHVSALAVKAAKSNGSCMYYKLKQPSLVYIIMHLKSSGSDDLFFSL